MKRSPFENANILATQIGSWLHNWSRPSKTANNYANAPELRNSSRGENLFRTRCVACHSIGAEEAIAGSEQQQKVGPDLHGVTQSRDRAWLERWLAEPDRMLAEKDPIAMELYAKYKNIAMPNLGLNETDVASLIDYMETKSRRIVDKSAKTLP